MASALTGIHSDSSNSVPRSLSESWKSQPKIVWTDMYLEPPNKINGTRQLQAYFEGARWPLAERTADRWNRLCSNRSVTVGDFIMQIYWKCTFPSTIDCLNHCYEKPTMVLLFSRPSGWMLDQWNERVDNEGSNDDDIDYDVFPGQLSITITVDMSQQSLEGSASISRDTGRMLEMQFAVTAPQDVAVRENRQTGEVAETTDMLDGAESSHEMSLGSSAHDFDELYPYHDGEHSSSSGAESMAIHLEKRADLTSLISRSTDGLEYPFPFTPGIGSETQHEMARLRRTQMLQDPDLCRVAAVLGDNQYLILLEEAKARVSRWRFNREHGNNVADLNLHSEAEQSYVQSQSQDAANTSRSGTLKLNLVLRAFHHYLMRNKPETRTCFSYDMELNLILDEDLPVPECPRRLTVLQREQAYGEKMMVGSALRRRGSHVTVHSRDLFGTFEATDNHYETEQFRRSVNECDKGAPSAQTDQEPRIVLIWTNRQKYDAELLGVHLGRNRLKRARHGLVVRRMSTLCISVTSEQRRAQVKRPRLHAFSLSKKRNSSCLSEDFESRTKDPTLSTMINPMENIDGRNRVMASFPWVQGCLH